MKDFANILLAAFAGLCIAFLMFAFLGLFVWLLGAFLVAFGIAWACGMKFSVTGHGQYIGYIRWTKFYKEDER